MPDAAGIPDIARQAIMQPPSNDVDQHGFPIPRKFADEPAAPESRPRGAKSPMFRRGVILLLMVVVGSIMFESSLKEMGQAIVGNFFASRANQKFQADDLPAALTNLDQAIHWVPTEKEYLGMQVQYLALRVQVRRELGDYQGALADCDRLLEILPKESSCHLLRGSIRQQLGQHVEAIDDLNLAVEYRHPHDPTPFNGRAYTRALANMQLEDALKDADTALEYSGGNNSAILDTRGYVHYLLGNNEEALKDLERAVKLAEDEKEQDLKSYGAARDSSQLAYRKRKTDENLAVILHHRGLVHEKLGHVEQAKSDLKRGDELGYNPEKGVW